MVPSRALIVLVLAGCQPAAAPARHELPVVSARSSLKPVERAHPKVLATTLVWRVLSHELDLNDAGAPMSMRVVVQLEVGDQVVGPFELTEPGCTLGSDGDDRTVVSGLTCYYAGEGDYVEVHEASPGNYVVTTYGQSESYPDEPSPPKVDTRELGRFIAARPPLSDAIVAADGGTYNAYGP